MHLTSALTIAQKVTNLFAQNNGAKPHIYRFSDAGVTSLKSILDAMQLDMASQYQLQISRSSRTVAQFKEIANMYGALVGEIFFLGGFLPDSVYDQIVKDNPDPNKISQRALMQAKQNAEYSGLAHLETPSSFYEFLTSLDPLSPTYWQQVYERLHLHFDSNTVSLDRTDFNPANVRSAGPGGLSNSGTEQLSGSGRTTGTKAVDRRHRLGIFQGLLEKIVFNASITLGRDHAEYLAKACRSAAAKSLAQVSRGHDPALFVSAVGTTCQRWNEDICRVLNETISPKITVRIRKSDFDYILPALNAESTEFGFHAEQENNPERARNFKANQDFCTFLIQSLQSQIPTK